MTKEDNSKLSRHLANEIICSGFIRAKESAACPNENLARLRECGIKCLAVAIVFYAMPN